MNVPCSRRSFLQRSLQSGCAIAAVPCWNGISAQAIELLQRAGRPRFLLGLAAYSFRDQFKDNSTRRAGQAAPAEAIDLFQFLDFCADHGCQGAELTSYFFPKEVTDDFLLRLKRHAFLRGVEICGTAIGNTFTYPHGERRAEQIALTQKWIDYAATMGAPHIRVFAGSTQGAPKADEKKLCLAALEECGEYAASKGVFLGLENHGGIVAEADDLIDIVRAVKNPWIGINLDSGNFHTTDPYADFAKCAPYAINVQIKTEMQKRGASKEPSDMPRLIKILRDANYQGYVTLEYEAAESATTAVPRHLAELKTWLQAQ